MKLKTLSLLAVSVMSILSASAFAQVQKCVDKNGKVTYAHAVCPANMQKKRTVMAYTPRSQPKASTAATERQGGGDDDLHELRAQQAQRVESLQKASQLLQSQKKGQ
ncbi:MAG: DUF4124 domain-containing protein [Burkholderiales bacterium]|nr:DUF4124 domain-containing protein [Burkholderiales bacterium]